MTEDRTIHEEFLTCLSMTARRRFERSPDTYALVLAAVRHGWKPQQLAKQCGHNLPTSPVAASRQMIRALQWATENKPQVGSVAVKTKPRRHVCNHPDGHICPWIDQADGSVERCECDTPGGAA